jgi:hypothetical protein
MIDIDKAPPQTARVDGLMQRALVPICTLGV